MEILTYKELCEKLNLERKTQKARELQIEKLKEQYEIEKIPNERGKYILYRELSEEEKQYIQDSKNYTKYITNLLLNLFAQNKEATCTFTYRELREKTGMVNDVYFPVKYKKQEIIINVPSYYTGNATETKTEWIGISDKMDEAILTYAIEKLKKIGLIEYYHNYKFYKIEKIKEEEEEEQNIYYPPHILTEEELSEFLQIQAETLKQLGLKNKQQLHFCSEGQKAKYYGVMNNFVKSKGYTNYARAITIIKPKELYKVAGYYAERFNSLQVQKYLKSKRFKTIPPFIHEILIKQLIKKKEGVL